MVKKRLFYSLPPILLLIVAVAGWCAADYLGHKARRDIIKEGLSSVTTLSIYVSATFSRLKGAVRSMSGSPWIAPALLPSSDDRDIEHANSVLDRYNFALAASVSYLMDADGVTVASSNRKTTDSFVGRSYRSRPYFREASEGQPGCYFGMGITSGKRGFYASHPVTDSTGKVIGAVVMKKNLDEMEPFFKRYTSCFLVNEDGIILLSSSPATVLKALWPLRRAAREKLTGSRQFGNRPFDAVMSEEVAAGAEITVEGTDYLVSRTQINNDGWAIVLLTPAHRIGIYQLTGILAIIAVCLLILTFSGIIYATNRSKEAFRQNEERKRLLLHAISTGIVRVDSAWRVTFVNSSALRMLGFAEEEMLNRDLHTLIHHSREDGSDYPAESCPLYASCTEAAECHITGEVLWRKDGSSFPCDYSRMPITDDGEIIGTVITFSDITDRKEAEDALKKSEEKYRTILEEIDEGYYETDLAGNFTFVNDAHCRDLGRSRGELIGMNYRQYSDEATADILYENFHTIYTTGRPVKRFSGQFISRDGKRHFTEFSAALLRDEEGKPVGFRGVSQDITQRKEAEEDLEKTLERFKNAVKTTIQVIISTVEARDPYTVNHQLRCATLARAIAAEMKLSPEKIEAIGIASSIHDLGKLSVPAEILSKPTKLTETEFDLIKEHARNGYEILESVDSPWPSLAEAIYQHHERMDGSGYPRNLKGDEILMEARILGVCDVVEAMASHRPYRAALGIDAALKEIEDNRGILYDADVVDACIKLFKEQRFQFE